MNNLEELSQDYWSLMLEHYVPYDLALALKELGYDNNIMTCYQEGGFLFLATKDDYIEHELELVDFCSNSDFNNFISAPTWQQIFDWFREVYHLDSYCYQATHNTFIYQITYIIYDENDEKWFKKSDCYDSMYKTRKGCLEQLINKIIKDKK